MNDVRSTVFVPFGKEALFELGRLRERKVCRSQTGRMLLFEVAGLLLLRALQTKRGKGSLGASELGRVRYKRFTF